MRAWHKIIAQRDALFRESLSAEAIETTLATLVSSGLCDHRRAVEIQGVIPDQLDRSQYILKHFAGHLSIGIVFAADPLPLPLGTVGRVVWVLSARLIETWRGRFAEARIHSLAVFGLAAIPLFGYLAYLYALRRHAPELAPVVVQSVALSTRGRVMEEISETWPPFIRKNVSFLWSVS